MVDSDGDTASRDCIFCSDTDEASVRTAWKKYHKRLYASCKLGKGSNWMEVQLKRIGNSHQDFWGHDLAIVRSEENML